MSALIKTFAGGMSFAIGAFIGTACIAYFLRYAGNKNAKQIIETNKRIEARMYDQVAILRRIADHIEKGGK